MVDRKLVVNETEAALVRRIFALYLDLRSAVAVARALNAESQTTKHHVSTKGNNHGARAWDRQAVLQVLRNPIPAGLMSCHGEVHEGQHQAIIDRGHLSPSPKHAGRAQRRAHPLGPQP